MRSAIHAVLVSAVLGAVASMAGAAEEPLAVNFVAATPRLHTAGQPNETALRSLAGRGYDMVINLAPPDNKGAVPAESQLLEQSGVAYLNIPVDWQNPTSADFERFSTALASSAADDQVLIHCQMNMRASMFTFLYRVIHEDVPVEDAFTALQTVWIPNDQWAVFGNSVLQQHGVAFEFPPAP